MNYILAICLFLYVRPTRRDGKSAALLMTAFRQWAEIRQADEMRFLVTSADNIEKTHDMFLGTMDFAHLGGNYAWPLTAKGKQALGVLQPSGQADTPYNHGHSANQAVFAYSWVTQAISRPA